MGAGLDASETLCAKCGYEPAGLKGHIHPTIGFWVGVGEGGGVHVQPREAEGCGCAMRIEFIRAL